MPKSRVKLKQYGVRINGVLVRKSFASAGEARKWQREQKQIQDEIRAGTRRHLEPVLLSVQAPLFLEKRQHMPSFGHEETWMGKYVLAHPHFPDKFLHELDATDWLIILGPDGTLKQQYELSNATHNRVRSLVHKLYEDARKKYRPKRALENPIHEIEPLPEPKRAPPILEDVEAIQKYVAQALLDEKTPGWGAFVAMKLNTGMRQQNLIPRRWKDDKGDYLDVHDKFIRSPSFTGFRPGTKGDEAERRVPINQALRAFLDDWRKRTRFASDEDFIACGRWGDYISPRTIWDAHKRTLERAGLPYLSEHKLRHTYAVHYLKAGGSIYDLKENLFHTTVKTTEIYLRALKELDTHRGDVFQVDAVPKKDKKGGGSK